MKAKLMMFSMIWLVFITVAHVSMNIGFDRFSKQVRVALTDERPELIVGFLPVT